MNEDESPENRAILSAVARRSASVSVFPRVSPCMYSPKANDLGFVHHLLERLLLQVGRQLLVVPGRGGERLELDRVGDVVVRRG